MKNLLSHHPCFYWYVECQIHVCGHRNILLHRNLVEIQCIQPLSEIKSKQIWIKPALFFVTDCNDFYFLISWPPVCPSTAAEVPCWACTVHQHRLGPRFPQHADAHNPHVAIWWSPTSWTEQSENSRLVNMILYHNFNSFIQHTQR